MNVYEKLEYLENCGWEYEIEGFTHFLRNERLSLGFTSYERSINCLVAAAYNTQKSLEDEHV